MILNTQDRNVAYFHGAAECGILTDGIAESSLHKSCILLVSPKYVFLYDFVNCPLGKIVLNKAHIGITSFDWSHVSFRDNFYGVF